MLAQVKEAAEAAGYRAQAVASYGKQIEALRELKMEALTVSLRAQSAPEGPFQVGRDDSSRHRRGRRGPCPDHGMPDEMAEATVPACSCLATRPDQGD